MKIFVSYSRRDAGDFADSIRQVLNDEGHEVFTDVSNIEIGSVWSSVIENNISDCDIFIAIVTHAALRSPNVEKEVLQAQRENKVIVPCMHKYVMRNQIKWNLTNLQGLEFKTEFDLAREMTRNLSLLYEKTRQKTTRDASNFGRQKQVTTETVGPWPTEESISEDKDSETEAVGTEPIGVGTETIPHFPWGGADEQPQTGTIPKNRMPFDPSRLPAPEKFCPRCKITWENGIVMTETKCPFCRSKGIRFKLPGDP